ncbi:AMP-binding protein [Pseudoalteromonas sp. TB51]|nr:AMP-binding protein [Pseudoalteromonas sp. TB51]
MKGCKILLASPSGFRGKNIIQNLLTLINNYDVAVMTAVPTVYAAMVEQITSQKISVPPLKMKFAICGAAPLSSDLQALFTKLTNTPLVEGYGSTEGSSVSTLMPVNPINKEASVGLPIPGITLKIADINEQGTLVKICDTLDVGEIIITGNNVFPGYVEDAHNQGAWVVDENGQQYFRTGDLGKIDESGYVSLCGRQKELIIRGGHNIDPKMIEDAATSHPDVTLAAAVPRPDSYAGEVPVLYVTLSPNSTLKLDALTAYVSANIPERAAIPKAIYIIDEIPLTAVGKIYKPELVCLEIKQTITEALSEQLINKAVQINVFADKKLGIKATILVNEDELNALQQQIKTLLTPYSFNYEVLALKTTEAA